MLATKTGNVASVFGRYGIVVATSGDYSVGQVTGAAPLASPTFTGVPAGPTATVGTNTTQLATTAFVLANAGTTSPAGPTLSIQYDNAGAFGAFGSYNATDNNITVGAALIGTAHAAANYLILGNSNLTQTGLVNYALLQSNAGNTYINASSGNSVNLRINNVDHAIVNANAVQSFTINTVLTTASFAIQGIASQTAPLQVLQGVSSTSTNRDIGYVDAGFISSTDASYTGFIRLCAQDFNATTGGREGVRVASTGTLPVVTITGATSICDGTDATKKITFSESGNTTGVTLTLAAQQATSQTLSFPIIREAETLACARAPTQTASATPTGTTVISAAKMLGVGATFTPQVTGRVVIIVTCVCLNSTIADGVNLQIAYGTGSAPTNGAAASGTTVGSVKHFVSSTAVGQQGMALAGFATGLANGTQIWVDLQFEAVTGGTATVKDVDILVFEV